MLAAAPVAGQEEVGRAARSPVIQDPRLAADSTLFPYEWSALNALEVELRRLRPALESAQIAALARGLPAIAERVEALATDTLPPLLVPRREEVRGRIVALEDAVRRARELTAAALAAPPPAPEEQPMLVLGEDLVRSGEVAAAAAETLGPAPRAIGPGFEGAGLPSADDLIAAPGDSAAVGGDAVTVYLDAWRDLYHHGEALLHIVRAPRGEET